MGDFVMLIVMTALTVATVYVISSIIVARRAARGIKPTIRHLDF